MKLPSISSKQQIQLIILVMALLVTGYSFWYAGVFKATAYNQNMINRAQNRLSVKAKKTPAVPKTTVSAKQLIAKQEQLTQAQLTLTRLQQRFVPLQSKDEQQRLRHEISELAASLQMRVIVMEDAQRGGGRDGRVAPKFEEVSSYYGRPLIVLQALTQYHAAEAFIQELGTLSYFVAPVHMRLLAEEMSTNVREAVQQQQPLRLELILSI